MDMLQRLLTGATASAGKALERLWSGLPGEPSICWYPSAGNCFRDLLVWRHYPVLREAPEPQLYIHTDYIDGLPDQDEYRDRHTRVSVAARHPLALNEPIRYRVDPAYASLAGLAPNQLGVELLEIHVQSDSAGEFRRPVLYFHMENFNWFEEFVLARGLRISHLFKLREGCGFGGARASVSNLYPFLARAGCRWLIADQEVHLDQHLGRRLTGRHSPSGPEPWQITRTIRLGELSGMEVQAHQLEPGKQTDWLSRATERITRGSPWAVSASQPDYS
ncbi:MAG: hypothetical protein EA370_12315 [Wenzhouxiangella sp.]|nr:MAG: hypothetical protein EA370_12315 [Wenzhouxiangella sp.]